MTHSATEGTIRRRTFMKTLWLAVLGAAGVLLRPGMASAKQVSVDIAKLPGIVDIGGSALLAIKKKKVLVIRVAEDKVSAIEPICSHQQCAVDYQKKWGEIRCSCHGSTFSKTGKVTKGPAEKDLNTWPAKIEGGKLLIEM